MSFLETGEHPKQNDASVSSVICFVFKTSYFSEIVRQVNYLVVIWLFQKLFFVSMRLFDVLKPVWWRGIYICIYILCRNVRNLRSSTVYRPPLFDTSAKKYGVIGELHGGLNEGIGMKAYLHGSTDFS